MAERERWIKLHNNLTDEKRAAAKCKCCSDTGVVIAFSIFGSSAMATCTCSASKNVLH